VGVYSFGLPGERAPRLEHDAESEQRDSDRLEAEPSGSGVEDEFHQFAMDCVDTFVMLLVGLATRSLLGVDSAVEVAELLLVTLERAAEAFDPLLETLLVPRAEADPSLELERCLLLRGVLRLRRRRSYRAGVGRCGRSPERFGSTPSERATVGP
jgi:hypothetical protein